MTCPRSFFPSLLAGVLIPWGAWADVDSVVIPYDPSLPLSGQTPQSYFLDAGAFARLWERAGREPDGGLPGGSAPGAGYTMVEGLHDVEWREEGIHVQSRYRVWVARSGWVRIPFVFTGAVIQRTMVDGAPGAYDRGDLLVQEPGWHLIESGYQVSKAENGREAQWRLPAATAGLLRVSGLRQPAVINGGLPVTVERQGEGISLGAALGNRESVHVALEGTARAPAMERPPLARVESLLTVSPGLRSLRSEVSWEFPGSGLRQFALVLDPAYSLVRLEIPNLESWKLVREGKSASRLEFVLQAAVTGSLSIALDAESVGGGEDKGELFPRVGAEASRLEETLVLAGRGAVQVATPAGAGAKRVAVPERFRERVNEGRLVAAFRGNGGDESPGFSVRPVVSGDVVRADCVYQLEDEWVDLFVRAALKPAQAPGLLAIGLPSGAGIRDFVAESGVARWWRGGDVLWVQTAAVGERRPIDCLINLRLPLPGQPGEKRKLPELIWPEGTEVSGDCLVLTHAGMDSKLGFAQAERIGPMAAESALEGFVVMPPYERRHAFSYGGVGFGAEVELQGVKPEFEVGWVLSAVVNETWIQLAWHLDLEVKRSALRQVEVRVVSGLPELRWEGVGLREVRSVAEGNHRVYTIVFQEEITDFTTLTAATEIPLVQGGARLPHLEVPGCLRQNQFAVLENRTRGGLETNLAKVAEVPGPGVPYLPGRMNNPKFYRLSGPDWFLGVGLTTLERVGGMEMVILHSEIVSAIRDNGEEWHHVAYRMRNQSLQFLPVRLRREMELIEVKVAAREVQPKRGREDHKTETVLIPLDPTRNADLPFLVELIYRRPVEPGTLPGPGFRHALEAPQLDLEGRTEAQTFWQVFLPAGYSAHKVAGVVNQIPQRQRLLALAEANLLEMERLGRAARSTDQAGIAWRNVLGLSQLTRECIFPGLGAEPPAAEFTAKLTALEEEARAFRPGTDFSLAAASPLPEPFPSGFAENSAVVVERHRKRLETLRQRAAQVRDCLKLNDFVALSWKPAGVETGSAPSQSVPRDAFPFAAAQDETALRFLESWRSPMMTGGAKAPGQAPRFGLDPVAPAVAVPPGGQWIESIEQPRAALELDPAALRARLCPEPGFPVEGEPLVFSKLKGDARLELAGERVARRDSLPVWGWFLGGLAAIQILARMTGRKRPIPSEARG